MATRRRSRALIIVLLILILLLVLAWAAWTLFLQPMLAPAPTPTPVAPSENSSTAAQAALPSATPTLATDVVEIVMTTQQIAQGGVVGSDLITLVAIPRKDYVPGAFYENPEDVIGKRARYNLQAHTPLTSGLVIGTEGSPESYNIPKGMVAVSIPISKLSSVSYGLQAGDHVNVIVSLLMLDLDQNFQTILPNNSTSVTLPGKLADQLTGTVIIGPDSAMGGQPVVGRAEFDSTLSSPVYVVPSEKQRPRLVSQTLVKDAIVLHVGLFPQGEPSVAVPTPTAVPVQNGQQPQQQPAQAAPAPAPVPVPDVITLVVSPQDAVSINYILLSGGYMNLAMRSPGDSSDQKTEAVTLQFVLDQYSFPNPAKLPYGVFGSDANDNYYAQNVKPFPETGSPATTLATVTPVPYQGGPQVTPTAANPEP